MKPRWFQVVLLTLVDLRLHLWVPKKSNNLTESVLAVLSMLPSLPPSSVGLEAWASHWLISILLSSISILTTPLKEKKNKYKNITQSKNPKQHQWDKRRDKKRSECKHSASQAIMKHILHSFSHFQMKTRLYVQQRKK